MTSATQGFKPFNGAYGKDRVEKFFSGFTKHIESYNKSVSSSSTKGVRYGKQFDITKNNCVCSVVESLDVLYRTDYFSKSRSRWTRPDDLKQWQKNSQRPEKRPPYRLIIERFLVRLF